MSEFNLQTKIQQKGKIYSGFPGVGKSSYTARLAMDIDSTHYRWSVLPIDNIRGEHNPEWPENYLVNIKLFASFITVPIFVSSHKKVRDGLVAADLEFTLVFPYRSLKNEYMHRYQKRGSNEQFLLFMDTLWDEMIDSCYAQNHCNKIILYSEQYLSDVII